MTLENCGVDYYGLKTNALKLNSMVNTKSTSLIAESQPLSHPL